MSRNLGFNPEWASAPGETIADIMEERDLSLNDLARRMGSPLGHVTELLEGRVNLTFHVAQKLQDALGVPADFWIARETQYREDVVRLKMNFKAAEAERWLRELPVSDMINFGWLPQVVRPADKLDACLRFFDVPDIGTWRAEYRHIRETAAFKRSPSFKPRPGAVAAWLRKGEIESANFDCKRWNAKRFREVLHSVRSLTRKKDPQFFMADLISRCADCGVAVAIVRAPRGCPVSGATRFLSADKALLLLSSRYLSDDQFWFAFFHEAGHLLLHGKRPLFLEGTDMADTREEKEADEFAARVLIPVEFQAEFLNLPVNKREIIRFARRVSVSPGVVVGQLQHLGRVRSNHMNGLKRRFIWTTDSNLVSRDTG